MPKSYKRKNIRNKTNKKYYKGGLDKEATITNSTSTSGLEARITNLEMNMPVCIGIKSGVFPIWVKRDITVDKFWTFIGDGYMSLINLDALCLLPNVRGLPLDRSFRNFMCENEADQNLFRKRDIQKLNEKCPGLFVA
jgi:hypothetical protein